MVCIYVQLHASAPDWTHVLSVLHVDYSQTVYFKYVNLSNNRIKLLGIEPTECSFNTGVYVFDVDQWRERNITSQLEYWMNLNTQ